MVAVIVTVPFVIPVTVLPLTVALVVSLELNEILPSPLPADGLAATEMVLPLMTVDGAEVKDIVRDALAMTNVLSAVEAL